MTKVLFTIGIPDSGMACIAPDARGQMTMYPNGCASVMFSIDLGDIRQVPWLIYGPGTQQPALPAGLQPQLVFNQIAEPDTHVESLRRCVELCRVLDVPVINDPGKIQQTGRDEVSRVLQGIDGLHMPRVVRVQPRSAAEVHAAIEASGIPYPVLFRTCGEHNGANMVKLDGEGNPSALEPFPLDGRDFYLSEFVDFAGPDGFYHKHRLALFDGEPILRHTLFDEHWNVHASSRRFMAQHHLADHELVRLKALEDDHLPRLRPVIAEVVNRLGLDYFGIDFAVQQDGTMVIFEANANMNILYNPVPVLSPIVKRVKDALATMIRRRIG